MSTKVNCGIQLNRANKLYLFNQGAQQARGRPRHQEASYKEGLCNVHVLDTVQRRYESRRNSTKDDFGIHNLSRSEVSKRRALSNSQRQRRQRVSSHDGTLLDYQSLLEK